MRPPRRLLGCADNPRPKRGQRLRTRCTQVSPNRAMSRRDGMLSTLPSRRTSTKRRRVNSRCSATSGRWATTLFWSHRYSGLWKSSGGQVLGQWPRLVGGPGLECGEELDLVDEAVLGGEQAEEQVAIGDDGGHEAGLPGDRHRPRASSPDGGGDRPVRGRPVRSSHVGSPHAALRARSDSARARRPRGCACGMTHP
jgi:hypothetical protein